MLQMGGFNSSDDEEGPSHARALNLAAAACVEGSSSGMDESFEHIGKSSFIACCLSLPVVVERLVRETRVPSQPVLLNITFNPAPLYTYIHTYRA